jgi:hypothetical protein
VDAFQPVGYPDVAQRRKVLAHRLYVVEIAVPTEFLNGHQELHRGDPQLRDEFRCLQQGAQRDQHGADACECHRDLHPLHAVGHDQPDPSALGDPDLDKRRGHFTGGDIELAVVDSADRVDHDGLVPVVGRAGPD